VFRPLIFNCCSLFVYFRTFQFIIEALVYSLSVYSGVDRRKSFNCVYLRNKFCLDVQPLKSSKSPWKQAITLQFFSICSVGFCTKRCATVFQMKQNLPHDGELKTHVQCFYDMGKENLYIMRSRLLKKKLWHTFVRKSLLKNIKKLAILQVISEGTWSSQRTSH